MPALFALGGSCALLGGPASALELGNVEIESDLGQPLRASIAYALHPDEHLGAYCISLGGANAARGLPAVRDAQLTVTGNAIRIRGTVPVADPLLSLSLTVACPGTPRLTREYALFVDPPGIATRQARPAAEAGAAGGVAQPQSAPAPRTGPRSAPAPIEGRATYRVQPGDTLSGIIARIPERRLGLWPSVGAIFAANPHAFAGGSPDRLRAGALLAIPESVYSASAGTPVADTVPAATAPPVTAVAPTAQATNDPGAAPVPAQSEPAPAAPVSETPAVPEPAAEVFVPRPDAPQAEPAAAAAAPPANERPAADVSPVQVEPASGDSRMSLVWLGGAGLLLMLGLLLFGRRIGSRFGSAPAGAFGRREDDAGEYAIADEEDTVPAVAALDVDLRPEVDRNGGIEVTYSALSTRDAIDAALAAGSEGAPEEAETLNTTAILEAEDDEPPADAGEYEISLGAESARETADTGAITQDRHAVQVESSVDDPTEYTVNQEVDYRILEQDYEDELTATQALNLELERAAREMRLDLDAEAAAEAVAVEVVPSDETMEMSPDETPDDTGTGDAADDAQTDVNETLPGDLGDAENDAEVSLELESSLPRRRA